MWPNNHVVQVKSIWDLRKKKPGQEKNAMSPGGGTFGRGRTASYQTLKIYESKKGKSI